MKKLKINFPGDERKPEIGLTYMSFNYGSATKEEVKKIFRDRYNQDPEYLFLGPPRGTLIYAGPVPTKPASSSGPDQTDLIQPNLL